MERSALIGGGAIVAALVGVAVFYVLLGTGSDDDLPSYTRVKPEVESLKPAGSGEMLTNRAGGGDATPTKPGDAPVVATPNQRVERDPEMEKVWQERRMEAINVEEGKATKVLNTWLREMRIPGKHHTTIRDRVGEMYEAKRSLTQDAENGVITHRVARKRMANERDALREDLLQYTEPAQMNNLAARFDKERVGVL